MDIETESVVDTTADVTEPSSESGAVDSTTVDSQNDTSPTAGSSDAPESANADSQQATPDATPLDTETAKPAQDPELTYKQRYADTQRAWQRDKAERDQLKQELANHQRELEQVRQQFKGIQPQEIEQYRAQAKVPVWDETSDGHQAFLELRRTYDHYEQDMRAAPDDATKQWLSQQMSQRIGPEGAKTLREWQTDVRRQEWERQTNPAAYYRKLIQKEAQPVIQQSLHNVSQTYQNTQSAQQEVQKWMKDNAEVANPQNIQAVLSLMEKGTEFSVAAARVERDHYRSLVSGANKAKQSAEEKERLLQGNAAGVIARNPNSAKTVDYKAVAKERGLTNERQRMDLLFELDQQGMLGPR